MALYQMTTRDRWIKRNLFGLKIEKVSDYHGHQEGMIRHSKFCPNHEDGKLDLSGKFRPGCRGFKRAGAAYEHMIPGSWGHGGEPHDDPMACQWRCDGPMDALYMETTHEGLVLGLSERNGYHDSDFIAHVWNPDTKSVDSITYASTRGWSYPNNATVDATEEMLEEYRQYCDRKAEQLRAYEAEQRRLRAEAEAKEPKRGRTVEVTSKRSKVPHGTVGTVVWYGQGRYGGLRVGIKKQDGETVWCSASCVTVLVDSEA